MPLLLFDLVTDRLHTGSGVDVTEPVPMHLPHFVTSDIDPPDVELSELAHRSLVQ